MPLAALASRAGSQRKAVNARIPNPIPASRNAIPTTIPNIATCSAKNEVFSAFVRAVSVTQRFRALFSIGRCVFGSTAASVGSFVSLPLFVR